MLQTPVAMIVFRRPEQTQRVFERIAAARPSRLLVIADGASPARAGEAEQCAAARAVIDRVDWPCEVQRNFSEENLGPEKRISSGLDWVFGQCESAIVLEDDELPEPTFFPFCAELLDRYCDDERVMAINGTSLQFARKPSEYSYYFSKYFHCWGFATWARAWKKYDVRIKRWPELRDTPWLADLCTGNDGEGAYHKDIFDRLHAGNIHTWDYQVTFAIWASGGLVATPSVNLISNIGYGMHGFYCKDDSSPVANMATVPMPFPLSHPTSVERDVASDRVEFENNIVPVLPNPPSLYRKLRRAVRRALSPVMGGKRDGN